MAVSVETPRPLPHLPSVQALRGLAALGVMVSHLAVVEARYSPDTLLGSWARWGMAGVDLFFVISGFIMVYVTWNLTRGRSAPLPFLGRRITRIYPLYWIISLAVLVVWFIRPDMVFVSNPDPDILRSFLLIPQDGEPLLAVGWTLIHEMYFYLGFALILLLPRRLMGYALGAWCVAVAAISSLGLTPNGPMAELVFDPLLFEFVAGAVLALSFLRDGTVKLWPIFAGLAVIFIGNLLTMMGGFGDVLTNHMARAVIIGPVMIALFAVYVLVLKARPGRVVVWLGDISYSLYLTHVLTLSLVGRFAARFMGQGVFDNILLIMVMIAAALAVAHLTYIFIERPLIRLFRRRRRPALPAADSAAH